MERHGGSIQAQSADESIQFTIASPAGLSENHMNLRRKRQALFKEKRKQQTPCFDTMDVSKRGSFSFPERVTDMAKKRLTQRFPWLVPLRRRQRVFCFYWGMRLDGRRYAAVRSGEELPRRAFEANSPLYNRETGWDMRYQENKVHNLKLAAAMLDGMLIQPGETFSFCRAIRRADHRVPLQGRADGGGRKLTAAPAAGCAS